MSKTSYGYCKACDCFDRLVRHHWFDNCNVSRSKMICHNCNMLLVASSFGLNKNHYLPDWDVQKLFVLERVKDLSARREKGECRRVFLINKGHVSLNSNHDSIIRDKREKRVKLIPSKVIAVRISLETYDRLDIRARRHKQKIGTYVKELVEKDIYRLRQKECR